jgi:hypothetical protein
MLIKQEIERYLAAEQTAYKQLAKQHYQKKNNPQNDQNWSVVRFGAKIKGYSPSGRKKLFSP